MEYTGIQEKALRQSKMSNVSYRRMWNSEHELGYSFKGNRKYIINIASDYPNKEVQQVVLLHELGHQIYGHLDVDIKEEFNNIKKILSEKGKDFSALNYYGGPHTFVNIAMDLYINSTLLTRGNIELMDSENLELCTLKRYGVSYQKDFRDYYPLLIDKIDENQKDEKGESKSGSNESGKNNTEDNKSENNEGSSNGKPMSGTPNGFLQDLPNAVSEFDNVDEDIAEAIKEENYKSGNEKSAEDNIISNDTVGSIIRKEIGLGGTSPIPSNLPRPAVSIDFKDSDSGIKRFLMTISENKLLYKQDSIRLHNHGVRKNTSGILYSSRRLKVRKEKASTGILIDCSGSMDPSSLIRQISTLKDSLSILDSNSSVIAWDSKLCGEWKLNNLPTMIVNGYDTDIAKGLAYLKNKKCENIIIYSDLGTDMESLNREVQSFSGNLYTILVIEKMYLDYYNSGDIKFYLRKNKSYMRIIK